MKRHKLCGSPHGDLDLCHLCILLADSIRFRKSKKRRELIAKIKSKLHKATEYELRRVMQDLT